MLNLSDEVIESIADKIVSGIQSWQTKDGWVTGTPGHEKFWNDYIKRVDPHEKKYKETIRGLLQEQADEVFENIKEYPNSPIMWQFDRVKSFRKIAEAEAKFVTQLYAQEGQKAIDLALKLAREQKGFKAEIGLAFDVNNPLVVEQLLKQTQRFPSGLIGTTEEDIRQAIATGISQGETIDQIADRVESKLSPSHILNRAELIARSEAIYAANAGAELGYIQSGVVEGKQWLIAWDERTCDPCLDMEGMTAPIGEPTWEKEGMNIGDIQGKYGLTFDYTEGEMPHPPLHPRCRCTIVPILKRITGEAELGKFEISNANYEELRTEMRGHNKLFDSGHIREAHIETKQRITKELKEILKKDANFMDYMESQCYMPKPTDAADLAIWYDNLETFDMKIVLDKWIHQWAITSGDGNIHSIMMQVAAKEEFKLSASILKHLPVKQVKEATEMVRTTKVGKAMTSFVKAQYQNTQAFLAKNNIDFITGYRGMNFSLGNAPGGYNYQTGISFQKSKMALQPISSFATDTNTAFKFAKGKISEQGEYAIIQQGKIPANRIISTAQSGVGCKQELEFVVLGGEDVFKVASFKTNITTTWEDILTGLAEMQ